MTSSAEFGSRYVGIVNCVHYHVATDAEQAFPQVASVISVMICDGIFSYMFSKLGVPIMTRK